MSQNNQPPSGFNLRILTEVMGLAGVRRLYVKRLSSNDNKKNGIYLGSGFEALNIIPNKKVYSTPSIRNHILKADLDFSWINSRGLICDAPTAKLILYPQYPEIRLSGFLSGCPEAPAELMTCRDKGRLLFLGLRPDGKILGYAAEAQSEVAKEFERSGQFPPVGVFLELPVYTTGHWPNSKEALLAELSRIHALGWIDSKRLKPDRSLAPCNSSNCGGYTLEAEFGITPNGFSDPDFMGWEIKQHGVKDYTRPESGSLITLMTPEPTGGYYQDAGVEKFIKRFGYADMRGREDRMNFGGSYKFGARVARTALTLVLDGYNESSGKIEDVTKGITLVTDKGEPAAIWGYAGLIAHWGRKHDKAVYVPSLCRTEPYRQYQYGGKVLLGSGTDFLMLLRAITQGKVYYDPGIKLEGVSTGAPVTKRRSQFRVKWKDLTALYNETEDALVI